MPEELVTPKKNLKKLEKERKKLQIKDSDKLDHNIKTLRSE